jgi:hypothetical protein
MVRKTYSIRREIDTRRGGLQVEDRSDERWVLVREAIVLLPSPRTGLDIVDAGYIGSPGGLSGHLVELAILNHHRVDDAQETLITWEDAGSTSQCITLQEPLASVFTEDLDHSAALGTGVLVPLEITPGVVEDSVKFVAD